MSVLSPRQMLSSITRRYAPAVLRAAAASTTSNPNPSWLATHVRCSSSSSQPTLTSDNTTKHSPLKPRFIPLAGAASSPGASRPTGPADRAWAFLLYKVKSQTVKEPEAIWRDREISIVKSLPRPNNAYSGRSVPVVRREVGLALNRLRRIITTNHLIRELRSTERHEKKGEKRRRLRSERWRRRFAHEVRKKVQLVNEIRARGS